MRKTSSLLIGLILLTAVPAFAQLPVAGLHTVFPPGAKAGTTLDVKITGQNLEGEQKLLFSHAGIKAAKTKTREPGPLEIGQKVVRNEFTVTVAGNVPPGNYDVRVQSRYGVSNARTFVVGTIEEVSEDVDNADPEATNHSREQAIDLKLPMTANGRVDGAVTDYFKFAAKKAQRVIVDCAARRIDGSLSALVTLFDANGRELARHRGYYQGDALADFSVPADGDYFIGVRAVDFAGTPGQDPKTKKLVPKNHNLFYRLTVSTAPFIDFVYPPSGAAGSTGRYTLYGRNLPGGKPTKIRSFEGKLLEALDVNISLSGDPATLATDVAVRSNDMSLDGIGYRLKSPAGQSNPVRVSIARAAVVQETEPNDDPKQSQQIQPPCEVVGQFYPRTDRDWVTFEVKKDRTYWVEVISNRLGLPVDPSILVQRLTTVETTDANAPAGKDGQGAGAVEKKWVDVLSVDDVRHPQFTNQRPPAIFSPGTASFYAATFDPWGSFTAPADGTYRVLVRLSNASREDPRWVYRLVIRERQPDFRLAVGTFRISDYSKPTAPKAGSDVIYKGGMLAYQVIAFRRDGFNGPIEITVEGLPSGVTCPPVVIGPGVHTIPLVLFAAENVAPWSGKVRVVGKAAVGDKQLVRKARAATVAGRTRLARDGIWLTVSGEAWPYAVTAGNGKIWETARNGKLDIPYKVTKRGELQGDVGLKLWGPPWRPNTYGQPRITQKKVTITNGKVTIEVPPDFPPGTYSFFLNCAGKIKYSLKPETLEAALARQKELEQVIADLGAKATTANATLAAAQKAATEAAAQAKKAADAAKAAAADKKATLENAAEAAAAKAMELEKNRQEAAKVAAAANGLVQQAKLAKQAADKFVEDTKKKVAPKDVNLPGFSTPITVKIHAAAFVLSPVKSPGAVRQGAKVEFPVTIQRLIGYAGPINIGASFPGVSNIKVTAMPIAQGQTQSKIVIEAAANATPGTHIGQVIARTNFNGQEQRLNQRVVLTINEVKAEQK